MRKIGYTGSKNDLKVERQAQIRRALAMFADDLEQANDVELMAMQAALSEAKKVYLQVVRQSEAL
jgi:hypothetical protein